MASYKTYYTMSIVRIIGERERANLALRLAQFFYIHVHVYHFLWTHRDLNITLNLHTCNYMNACNILQRSTAAIGKQEQANLVVQLAQFFLLYIHVHVYLCLCVRYTVNVLLGSKFM